MRRRFLALIYLIFRHRNPQVRCESERATGATNRNVKDTAVSCFARRVLRGPGNDGRTAMRWCVSIGAVLVAGAIAASDVAGIAAPDPRSQLVDAKDNLPSVDVEL